MKIGYIALCLIVPLLWGLVSARLFDWWQARGKTPASPPINGEELHDDPNPHTSGDMYHI